MEDLSVAPPAAAAAGVASELAANTAPSAASRLPFAGTAEEEQALAEQNAAAWKLLDQYRLDPARPASCSYQRLSDVRVSTTDPDAVPMRAHLGDRAKLGYHDHYVVDGGKARIILAAFVTPADVMENTPMLDLLRRVRFRWQLHPERAVGDTTYGTIENIRTLEDAGLRAYVPLADFEARTPYFGASRFTYDPEREEYRCPQDQPLRRLSAKYTLEVVIYRAEAATCNACPLKPQCTASDAGRQLRRSFYTDYLDRVRAYHETADYRKAMRKRAVWVEPLFGEAKEWHGLRQFRLRGLWKVNCEALRTAAGQNLKRWLTRTGWGRRYGPAGSLALARPTLSCRPQSSVSLQHSSYPVCVFQHAATFWHLTSEGATEDERIPDLQRCERIGWVRAVIDAAASGQAVVWENVRPLGKRVLVAPPDFSFVVVLAERETYLLLWTSYPVEQQGRRRRLHAEYEA